MDKGTGMINTNSAIKTVFLCKICLGTLIKYFV